MGSLVARSGAVKSPPVEHAIDPLMRIDLELRRASNEAIQAYKDAVRARKEADRERKAAARKKRSADSDSTALNDDPFSEPGGDDPGELPPKRRCVAQDITIESLALILSENPKGVLVYRDELASWFNALGRYSRTDTTADWLTLFHARTLTVDRKTGDKVTVAVPNAAASLVGTIQPKVLARTFTPEFRASGGAARLLVVMPPRQKVWTEVDVPRDVSEAYELLIRRLRSLEPHAGSSRTTPLRVPFSDEARTRWGEFVNEWGRVTFEAGEEDDDLAAAFGKLEAYAARLALIHHLVTRAGAGPIPGPEPVGLDSLEAGIVLARWFANETERVYAALVEGDRSRRRRELVERIQAHGGRVTVRDLQKSNSRKYRTAEVAEADLNALVAAGWGRWEESRPSGGAIRDASSSSALRPTLPTLDPTAQAAGPQACSTLARERTPNLRNSRGFRASVGSVGRRKRGQLRNRVRRSESLECAGYRTEAGGRTAPTAVSERRPTARAAGR